MPPVSPLLIQLISGFQSAVYTEINPNTLMLIEVIENGVSVLKSTTLQTIVDQTIQGATRTIVNIELVDSQGLVDTYHINYTDSTYDVLKITNGSQGVQGFQGDTGAQGNQGFQGNTGTQGNQGTQGDIGLQGYQGFQGNTGAQGNQGYQGTQGYQGDVGVQGDQGIQGNIGFQGFQGYQGFQGNTGTQGNQGYQGTQGYQGDVGVQGNQGSQGHQGFQGSQGYMGPQGLGTQGTQGYQGAQGHQGLIGSQGYQGVQGYQGLIGSQGSQGYQGFVGSQGYSGFQGNQGYRGVQGYDGDMGSQGSQGNQGFQGSQGNQGTQGFHGFQGAQGYQGAQGNQGFIGSQGAQGNQGFQGSQGYQGTQGFHGFQGAQGYQGAQGNQGLTGSQGYLGYQGSQGYQGLIGSQGYQGIIGSQGYKGTQGEQGSVGSVSNTNQILKETISYDVIERMAGVSNPPSGRENFHYITLSDNTSDDRNTFNILLGRPNPFNSSNGSGNSDRSEISFIIDDSVINKIFFIRAFNISQNYDAQLRFVDPLDGSRFLYYTTVETNPYNELRPAFTVPCYSNLVNKFKSNLVGNSSFIDTYLPDNIVQDFNGMTEYFSAGTSVMMEFTVEIIRIDLPNPTNDKISNYQTFDIHGQPNLIPIANNIDYWPANRGSFALPGDVTGLTQLAFKNQSLSFQTPIGPNVKGYVIIINCSSPFTPFAGNITQYYTPSLNWFPA